jgi:hypothetical protein
VAAAALVYVFTKSPPQQNRGRFGDSTTCARKVAASWSDNPLRKLGAPKIAATACLLSLSLSAAMTGEGLREEFPRVAAGRDRDVASVGQRHGLDAIVGLDGRGLVLMGDGIAWRKHRRGDRRRHHNADRDGFVRIARVEICGAHKSAHCQGRNICRTGASKNPKPVAVAQPNDVALVHERTTVLLWTWCFMLWFRRAATIFGSVVCRPQSGQTTFISPAVDGAGAVLLLKFDAAPVWRMVSGAA